MAHNLDITEGEASFVSARQDAWHALGTVVPDAMTAEDALRLAHLAGWNVRKIPAFGADPETGEMIPMTGRNAVIRDNPINDEIDFLGDVGDSYSVIQNEEHAAFLNHLVEDSGAHFETAGAIDGGRRVFVTMKMPDHLRVGDADPVENYIAAINSHDGNSAFTLMVTPIRIVCQNTLNVALTEARNSFKIRHTSGSEKAIINEARVALDLTFRYLGEFEEQAERMIQTTMTQSQFEEIIAAEFGAPADAPLAVITRADNKLDQMAELFAEANTQEGIRDTAWAGFNALTEYCDHFSPVRGDDRDTKRLTKAVLKPDFKQRALAIMTAR